MSIVRRRKEKIKVRVETNEIKNVYLTNNSFPEYIKYFKLNNKKNKISI